MKRILIFTAGFGEGHNTAARNIRDAVEFLAADETQVEIVDLFEVCYGRFNDFVRKAYLTAIDRTPKFWGKIYNWIDTTQVVESNLAALSRMRRAMEDVLIHLEPDAVVSTYPIYNHLIAEIFKDGRERTFSQITMVTDSISVNAVWFRCPSDYFLVANEETAAVLRRGGVEAARIHVFGFPISYRFAELSAKRPDPAAPERRVLYMINSGKNKAHKLVRKLCRRRDVRLVVTTGRDPILRRKIEEAVRHAAHPVEIHGWTSRLPEILCSSHLVISKAGGATVQEAIASGVPMILNHVVPGQEEGNAKLLLDRQAGVVATKNREVLEAVDRAFANDGEEYQRWHRNITDLSQPTASLDIARFVVDHAVPDNAPPRKLATFHFPHSYREPAKKSLLLCDLHSHTTFSDGKLALPELIDFYGQRGFDAICVTDHICDQRRLLGRFANLTGMVVTPDQVGEYFSLLASEKNRAWRKYGMLVMTGLEFNKDGVTGKSSAHLLGIDLKQPIDPSLDLPETIERIHEQGGLAIASHPHEWKSSWGKNTLYLWDNIETFAPLLDAWEIANRDDIFNPIGLKRLPFVANSDFHKPKHIHSWKTVLYCEKDPEAIKECIRINRDVTITLYRDHKVGFGYGDQEQPARTNLELVKFPRKTA